MTRAAVPAARHTCPKCKIGFIVLAGATDDEVSTCINCGYRAPIEGVLPRVLGGPRLRQG
jgi:hypothetical protein